MDNGRFTALTVSGRSVWLLLMISAAVMPESRIAKTAAAGEVSEVLFDRDIRSILVRTCYRCHGPDAGQRQAGLDLTSRDSATEELPSGNIAIVPEHPEHSQLISRIRSTDPDLVMPPRDSRETLTSHEKELLEEWIRQGSPFDRHWAFRSPVKKAPPEVQQTTWPRNEIDRFILAAQEERQISPATEASPSELIRRLYLDVIGVPPEPEEVDAFVAKPDPGHWDEIVDRLLNDVRYGERWARYWLDLARYADTAGYEGDPEYPHAWRYRDYVIDTLNSDKPYSDFIREQIAGDELVQITGAGELVAAKPEHQIALTFLRLAPFTEPRGDETREEMLSEMTGTVGSVFLGLTVGCARCHDHKYDAIPTRDFYRMKGFFASIQIPPPLPGDGFQLGGPMPVEFYRPDEKQWADTTRSQFESELQAIRQQSDTLVSSLLEKLKKDSEDSSKNSAGSPSPGVPKVEDIRKALRDPADQRFLMEDRKQFLQMEQREFHLRNSLKRLQPLAMSLRHSFGPPYEPGMPATHILVRGEYDHRAESVAPGFLSAVTGNSDPAPYLLDPYKRWPTRGWRKLLADWIATPENPLTSRVIVNRLWHHHFGRGIVTTTSDFGTLGSPPTHPELLDWLAVTLVENRWSLKHIHRLILKSATFRQTSVRDAVAADPENQLLWRFPRRRLDAEAIRDSFLTVSGQLNSEHFGLPIFPPLPENLAEVQKVQGKNRWETQTGPESRKRSLYIFQRRSLNVPMMDVLDSLVPNSTCPSRRTSVTSLQALELYNGEFANEMARCFAERIRKRVGDDPDRQIAEAYRIVFARKPADDELRHCLTLMTPGPSLEPSSSPQTSTESDDRLVQLGRVLMNTNEFLSLE